MSWVDFTRAKHYGNGIFLPYSDLLGDIAINFDNLLASKPTLAHSITPISDRDIILVKGSRISLLVLSSNAYRHLPFFQTYEWSEFFDTEEKDVIETYPSIIDSSSVLSDNNLLELFIKNFSMKCPILIILPSVFQVSEDSQEQKIRNKITYDIAEIILTKEIRAYKEKEEMEKNTEIFLSHKSIDKSLVRVTASTLKSIGYSPWLDEDKMKAGAHLERAIRTGFETSCAAVFFITPSFKDEGFLASEVDYAIAEKRDKKERFAIITLLIPDDEGNYGEVPKLLTPYVFKKVQPLEIVKTIVEALPIKLNGVNWKK